MESPEDVALSSDGSINALLREKLKVVIFKSSCITKLKRAILQFFDFKIRSCKFASSFRLFAVIFFSPSVHDTNLDNYGNIMYIMASV